MNQPSATDQDRELDRQGRRFGASGLRFLVIGAVLVIPGIVLIILGHGWVFALGLVFIVLGVIPSVVSLGLLGSGGVARWAARRKPFA